MADERIRRHVIVHGRVQGVWFRDTTRRVAMTTGVDGWVANRYDGTVEAVIEGAPDDVQAMLRFLRTGPPRAHVAGIDVTEEPLEGIRGFAIR